MTKKKLAVGKAWFSLAIIFTYVAFCAFFFTYGRNAVQRAVDEMGQKQTMGGLGPAIMLMFAIITLIAFAVPAIMCLISSIGNFKGKGEKLVGFTVVGLIAEIFAIITLIFLTSFTFGAVQYDALVMVVTGVFDLLVLVSFVHSIFVLAKQKTADEE